MRIGGVEGGGGYWRIAAPIPSICAVDPFL